MNTLLSIRTKTHINYCYEHVLMCILTMKFDKSHVCISPPIWVFGIAKPKLCPPNVVSFVCGYICYSLFKFSACRMLRRITDCNLMAMVVSIYSAVVWFGYFGLACSFSFRMEEKYIMCIKFDIYLFIVPICLQSNL